MSGCVCLCVQKLPSQVSFSHLICVGVFICVQCVDIVFECIIYEIVAFYIDFLPELCFLNGFCD